MFNSSLFLILELVYVNVQFKLIVRDKHCSVQMLSFFSINFFFLIKSMY